MRLNKILNPSALLLAIGMMSLMGAPSVHAAQPEPGNLVSSPPPLI